MEGYKVFRHDWTCRGFQYEVGKIFEMDATPLCCNKGFHFCKELRDCFSYYPFNPDNKVAKVIALGEVDESPDHSQYCTNKIQIAEEISWEDVLRMVNSGRGNTGKYNSGNYNSGDYNSGNYNSGGHNSGNYNSGDCNSGNYNSGDCNSGDYNSGNHNHGDWNRGDWNKTNFSDGCFNTEESKIYLFNKLSDWTYNDWLCSEARLLLREISRNSAIVWIYANCMTDKEKKEHPEYKTTGGYLKTFDNSYERNQLWWYELSEAKKDVIKSIPNFDREIFESITGIKV